MRGRYLLSMASLCLVDSALTGVYAAISGRMDVLPTALAWNVAILGVVNVALASVVYRPIARAEQPVEDADAARAAALRLRSLPAWSATVAFVVSSLYCVLVFTTGTFTPGEDMSSALPLHLRIGAAAWFVFVYSAYYALYVYFLIGDFSESLRERMFHERGLAISPRRGGFRRKLGTALIVLALLPSTHVILDLTVFASIRTAQGLDVVETVFLDLLATLVVFSLALVFITRALTRPVNSLASALEDVGRGKLERRAAVLGDDELGVLTATFNRMIDGLQERALIRETFGKYVPERVVNAIVEGRGPIAPELATATILFADIVQFTTICESMEPADVVAMLNEYYRAAVAPIERHGGVINQFQGDAMLVTFNVPVRDANHARNAVAAALQMRAAIEGKRFAGVELRARIGINTGPVVAGNVGSEGRFSYTVHGDAVNVAARLEQMNKTLGTDLLIGQNTVELLGEAHGLVAVGELAVPGKRRSVTAFGLSPAGFTRLEVSDRAHV